MGLLNGIDHTNMMQRGGTLPPTATQNAGLQIPKLNPAVAQAPLPAVMPSYLGSGSNFKDFKAETAFANISPKPLTPTYRQDLNAHMGVGAKLNCIG
jgi:hypothetical protein